MEERILTVLRNVFNDTTIDTTCSQQSCKAWDSMNHLNLVVELEMEFDVNFDPEEIAQMTSIKEIEAVLLEK